MKTEELMCGDWVSVMPSLIPIQVAAVHHKKVGYHNCNYKLNWIRQDLLRPIPITATIMNKNGFKYDKSNCGWAINNNGTFISDDLDYGNEYEHSGTFSLDVTGDEGLVFVFLIQYVHELQHVLRLCKVDKQIVF